MPNGLSRPEAKILASRGLASLSLARRTRIRPGSDSATKRSPLGATTSARGSLRSEAKRSTSKPGGTLGEAAGRATMRGKLFADRVANGFGRSSTVILRRTSGESARQSPNAALPARSRELSAGSGPLWARAAAANASNIHVGSASEPKRTGRFLPKESAVIPQGFRDERSGSRAARQLPDQSTTIRVE